MSELPEPVLEALGQASQDLLNAIQDTAQAQFKLVQLRQDREVSPEAVADAATKYRTTESVAQEALSTLLNYWVVVFESQEEGKPIELRPQAAATPPEVWRSKRDKQQ